jgi:hypothetical protein
LKSGGPEGAGRCSAQRHLPFRRAAFTALSIAHLKPEHLNERTKQTDRMIFQKSETAASPPWTALRIEQTLIQAF